MFVVVVLFFGVLFLFLCIFGLVFFFFCCLVFSFSLCMFLFVGDMLFLS